MVNQAFFKFLILVFCSAISYRVQATVHRVNNNAGVDADYTTIQNAINGASAGDTIYVEGSPDGYGNATLSKQLVIYGAGYFLSQNDSTQALLQTSSIGIMTVSSGGAGSIIQGLTFSGSSTSTHLSIDADNVTVRGNYFYSSSSNYYLVYVYSDHTGFVIQGNWLNHAYSSSSRTTIYLADGASGNIMNNFIKRLSTHSSAYALNFHASVGPVLLRNNVIYGNMLVYNTTMANNIMLTGTFTSGTTNEDYNMCNSSQFSGTNSLTSVDMSTVFEDYTSSVDNGYELASGSSALSAGQFGEDLGMFGGVDPYRLSGMPSIPSIFFFTQSGAASDSNPLQIEIKARSNN